MIKLRLQLFAEGEPDPAPNPDPEPQKDPEPNPNTNPEPNPNPDPEPQKDPDKKPDGEPKPDPEPKPEVNDEFIKSAVDEQLGELATPELVAEFGQTIKEIGITDTEMAKKAIDYVCNARMTKITNDSAETLKFFGATDANLTPEYTKAMDEAKTAMNALEIKIPGLKQVINESGLQCNLKVVRLMQSLLPYVGEDTSKMNGASNAKPADKGFAETIFAGYPSEKDVK